MTIRSRKSLFLVIGVFSLSVVLAQMPYFKTIAKSNPAEPSGAYDVKPSKFPSGKQTFTLVRGRDFRFVHGDVDCPNCKNMYCARLSPPAPGAKITAISVSARRPTVNNHFYRCQVEAKCGVPEFSDPADARQSCIDKPSCNVCRATDDGVPNYEDDIAIEWK
jgi:hypothetical protein